MTKRIPVERLNFDFPDGWEAGKYDDWKFYRNNFCTMFDGIKAVDILAVAPDETAYLIEVKDYRVGSGNLPSAIVEELCRKAVGTLAALLPASLQAGDPGEQKMPTSKVFPQPISPVSILQKLKRKIWPIDASPLVASISHPQNVGWSVQDQSLPATHPTSTAPTL